MAKSDEPGIISTPLERATHRRWTKIRARLATAAAEGDVAAMRELLVLAATAVRAGAPLPDELRTRTADVLDALTAERATRQLMATMKLAKRGPPVKADRDFAIMAVLAKHLPSELRRRPHTPPTAKELAKAKSKTLDDLLAAGLPMEERRLNQIVERSGYMLASHVTLTDNELAAAGKLISRD